MALDNQLISVVEDRGFHHHLEFWIPSMPYHLELQGAGMHTSFMGLVQQNM